MNQATNQATNQDVNRAWQTYELSCNSLYFRAIIEYWVHPLHGKKTVMLQRSVSQSVGWSVGRSVGQSVSQWVGWLVGLIVGVVIAAFYLLLIL